MIKNVDKNPLISIVVPIYNVEKYLTKCLESILNQTYKNIEIILVNDGSTDNSKKICEEYIKKDSRIILINKKNGGLSDARNKGIDKSTGEYITFIDSDDYIELDYIMSLYKGIQNNNIDLVISGHRVLYDTGKIIEKKTCGNIVLSSKETLEKMLYDEGVDVCSVNKLYKKNLFDDIRFPKGREFEDSATTYKLIDKSKKIAIIDKITYNYSIRSDSITTKNFNPKKMELILSTKEMCDFIRNKYPDLNKACDRRLMYAYLSTLSQMASSNKRYLEYENICLKYIKENSNKVLKDKRICRRDKFALYSLKFGYNFFRFSWNLYRRWSNRI